MIKNLETNDLGSLEPSRHTVWLDPAVTTQTQYGTITNMQWCLKEKQRIEQRDGIVEIYQRPDTKIALVFRHAILTAHQKRYYGKKDLNEPVMLVS